MKKKKKEEKNSIQPYTIHMPHKIQICRGDRN